MATKKKRTVSAKRAVPVIKKTVAKKHRSNFWKVDFNINTLYWMAIGIAVIATAAWTYNTNQQITEIYDSIDSINSQVDAETYTDKPKPVIPDTN